MDAGVIRIQLGQVASTIKYVKKDMLPAIEMGLIHNADAVNGLDQSADKVQGMQEAEGLQMAEKALERAGQELAGLPTTQSTLLEQRKRRIAGDMDIAHGCIAEAYAAIEKIWVQVKIMDEDDLMIPSGNDEAKDQYPEYEPFVEMEDRYYGHEEGRSFDGGDILKNLNRCRMVLGQAVSNLNEIRQSLHQYHSIAQTPTGQPSRPPAGGMR